MNNDGIFQLSVGGGEKKEGSVKSKKLMVFSSFRLRKVRPMENKEPSNVKLLHKTTKQLKHLFL